MDTYHRKRIGRQGIRKLRTADVEGGSHGTCLLVFRVTRQERLHCRGILQVDALQLHCRGNLYRKQVHQLYDMVTRDLILYHRNADALADSLLPITQCDVRGDVLRTRILSIHLLCVVAHGRLHFRVIEINQVGIPLRMAFLRQQRGVRGHLHHIGITFHRSQIESFCQRCLYVVGTSGQVGGIFAQIDLGLGTVITVVVVLVVNHPARIHVIVFVHHGHAQFRGKAPALRIVRAFVEGSYSADNRNFGMLLPDSLVYHGKALLKHFGNHILVADADILQIERLGMACLSTLPAPHGAACIAVGILYQVEHILDIGRHLFHRDATLLAVAHQFLVGPLRTVVGIVRVCARILARHARCQYRQRFGTYIFAEAEVLEVAQSACLMIPPQIAQRLTGFERSDRAFPIIDIVDAVAMSHAAAGEADEAWMQVGKRLRQVGTQAVLMALECILRKKGNHIEMQCPHRLRLKREHGGTHIGVCRQHRLLFLPLFGGHIDGRAGNLTARLVEQANNHLASLAARCHAGEEREIVLLPFLQADAVETVVLQCHSGTRLQYGIMRVIGMNGVGSGNGNGSRSIPLFHRPGICAVPTLV